MIMTILLHGSSITCPVCAAKMALTGLGAHGLYGAYQIIKNPTQRTALIEALKKPASRKALITAIKKNMEYRAQSQFNKAVMAVCIMSRQPSAYKLLTDPTQRTDLFKALINPACYKEPIKQTATEKEATAQSQFNKARNKFGAGDMKKSINPKKVK